jgi:hypothetical protein
MALNPRRLITLLLLVPALLLSGIGGPSVAAAGTPNPLTGHAKAKHKKAKHKKHKKAKKHKKHKKH